MVQKLLQVHSPVSEGPWHEVTASPTSPGDAAGGAGESATAAALLAAQQQKKQDK